jgi:hypothetical protein
MARCKTPADKVIAAAKLLRGKLAKAPAHKQPLHTQYLPSALRDSGKRQLDCLGVATAVLAMCHLAAAKVPELHAELQYARMLVSDDHCWLALPANTQGSSSGAGDGGVAQPQLVHVEVTDPRRLAASDMTNWLYAGGNGTACTPAQVWSCQCEGSSVCQSGRPAGGSAA